jgi:hypothetical protein
MKMDRVSAGKPRRKIVNYKPCEKYNHLIKYVYSTVTFARKNSEDNMVCGETLEEYMDNLRVKIARRRCGIVKLEIIMENMPTLLTSVRVDNEEWLGIPTTVSSVIDKTPTESWEIRGRGDNCEDIVEIFDTRDKVTEYLQQNLKKLGVVRLYHYSNRTQQTKLVEMINNEIVYMENTNPFIKETCKGRDASIHNDFLVHVK